MSTSNNTAGVGNAATLQGIQQPAPSTGNHQFGTLPNNESGQARWDHTEMQLTWNRVMQQAQESMPHRNS